LKEKVIEAHGEHGFLYSARGLIKPYNEELINLFY